MEHPHRDEYRARAEECNQRAAITQDPATKTEWVKLARSWQALAERTGKTLEIAQ
jgi:hypothetical protein